VRYRKGRVSPGTLSVCFIPCIAVSQGEWIGDCSKELGKKAAERCKRRKFVSEKSLQQNMFCCRRRGEECDGLKTEVVN